MSNAQLSEQCVDGADLHASSAARVPEFGGCDMVFAIRLYQGKGREVPDDQGTGLRCGEPLKQFLENQPGRDNNVGAQKGVLEHVDFGCRGRGVSAQSERPHARVHKQGHGRERSAL